MKCFFKDKNGIIKFLIVIPFLITFLLNTFYFSKKDNNVDTLNTNEINKDSNNDNKDNIINNNDEVKENNIDNNYSPINNNSITEEDPLILSNKYHEGFEKRKNSSLYPYKPYIRKELPRMYIYSSSGNNDFATKPTRTTKDDYEERCQVSIVNCEEQYTFLKVDATIKVRGNSTADKAKKPFRLKFDVKRNLLGLNNNSKFKSWVLNALDGEGSFLRDQTAYYLGKQIFNYDNLYNTDTALSELYINNTYWGLYLVQEKQQVNKNRVNIDDVEDREPKGAYTGTDIGYFFEYDGYASSQTDNQVFRVSYHDNEKLKTYSKQEFNLNDTYVVVNTFSVHSDIYSDEQLSFIGNYVDKVYYILYEAVYNKRYYVFDETYTNLIERNDLTSYEVIDKVININSFVDKFILEEIMCNPDLYWSQYFSVDMSYSGDKKLTFQANWDYDYSLNGTITNGLCTCEKVFFTKGNKLKFNPWFFLLPHEKWFIKLAKEKWYHLIENQVLYNALHYIDEFKINYSEYYIKSRTRWNSTIDIEKDQNNLFTLLKNRINYLHINFTEGRRLF